MADDNPLIFSIKRFSLNDGPGIRTTVFLKGCPLKCPWCHNPESISSGFQFFYKRNLCVQCGQCAEICPHKFDPRSGSHEIPNLEICCGCRRCFQACSTGAISGIGEQIELPALLSILENDRDFFGTDGGVTFSGGEPLLYPHFLNSILSLCKASGINTCIETSGDFNVKGLGSILNKTNVVIFDLKILNNKESGKYFGKTVNHILKNLETLIQSKPTIIRIPMISGITDTDENINLIINFITSHDHKNIIAFELLPYHNLGENKYKFLGADLHRTFIAPSEGKMNQIKERLSQFNRRVKILYF